MRVRCDKCGGNFVNPTFDGKCPNCGTVLILPTILKKEVIKKPVIEPINTNTPTQGFNNFRE